MLNTRSSAYFKVVRKNLKYNLPSSIVVFLVALPLCLGIAMASGAPLFAGLLTGIIGGLVIASISGSQLSVSGPAAGLTVIVFSAISTLGYNAFLLAVVLAGAIQLVLGLIKAGTIGNYFPSAVIEGMLAAIGITIILKQIPHALGYDADFFGSESFKQLNGENTIRALESAFNAVNTGALIITLISLATLIYWPKLKKVNIIPAPLIVVFLGVILAQAFNGSSFEMNPEHLVEIPVVNSFGEFIGLFTFPKFSSILDHEVWVAAFTIAIVASLETLLSIEAIDKLDPYKRVSPTNRELMAQGVGNMTSGMLGGLPLTSVIVRSSANANAGGKTKQSAILHSCWLLLALLIIPTVINMIPLACLAAILLLTGYKLAKISLFKKVYKKGFDQFIPFIITILAVIFTDLLKGVAIGLVVAIFYILRNNMRNPFGYDLEETGDDKKISVYLSEEVSFLNKAAIQQSLHNLPKDVNDITIDGSKSRFIDKDVVQVIKDYEQNAISSGKKVQLVDIYDKREAPNINYLVKKKVPKTRRKNSKLLKQE